MRAPTWLQNARGVEIAAICLSLPAAALSIFQAISASEDARQANEAKAAAEKLAAASERQAAIATAQARFAERLATIQGRQLDVAKAERDATVRLATSSEQNTAIARDQINAAAKNVSAEIAASDQREWRYRRARIAVDALNINLEVGQRPQGSLVIRNTGSTPALNVNIWSSWHWQENGKLPDTPLCNALPQNATMVVSGAMTFNLQGSGIWSAADTKRVSPQDPLYVIGSICYEDEQRIRYQTTFCRYFDGSVGEGAVKICPIGERAR
jgi:hypothetical protein